MSEDRDAFGNEIPEAKGAMPRWVPVMIAVDVLIAIVVVAVLVLA